MNCVYLKESGVDRFTADGREVYECMVHQVCTKEGRNYPYASCPECNEGVTLNDVNLKSKFIDHLQVFDRRMNETDSLRNLLSGGSAFLICGGPSAKTIHLSQLQRRGIFSLAINNMAGYARTNAFLCSDPPCKFHDGIWKDPSIMKFVPTPKLTKNHRGKLRTKNSQGFCDLETTVMDCPNVWGFSRRSWFKPDESFFTEDTAAWGNHDAGVLQTGEPKTVCTMLLGIRVLYYLGARVIYLVGVDFHMDPDRDLKENYAFAENRDQEAINTNNNQYAIVMAWLDQMSRNGVFEKFGLQIFNTNLFSALKAFPYKSFISAIHRSLQDSQFPEEPFDLEGWYGPR